MHHADGGHCPSQSAAAADLAFGRRRGAREEMLGQRFDARLLQVMWLVPGQRSIFTRQAQAFKNVFLPLSIYLSIYLSIFLPSYLPTYLSIRLSVSTYIPTYIHSCIQADMS